MRSLGPARTAARNLREAVGGTNRDLLNGLRRKLWSDHHVELVPADKRAFLQGSRGELVLAEGCLYYDRALDARPDELLEVVAHEYGHLLLHHRQFGADADDLIRGSAFLDTGAPALSRYSPRSQEEAEASAFAAELICPASAVFERWRSESAVPLDVLAAEYGATPALIRQQLAEGLYTFVAGPELYTVRDMNNVATPEQEAAATACGAPVLVDAGPGTGKTRTLVRRIEFLVNDQGVAPENILVLTFSNEAAGELRDRIRGVLGDQLGARLLATTFHGFGVVLLNTLGHHVGLDVDFGILDEVCQEELLEEIVGQIECEALLDIKDPTRTTAHATQQINYLKDRLISPEGLKTAIAEWAPAEAERDSYERSTALLRLFERYEAIKTERHQVDFADLIALPQRILSGSTDVREGVRKEFQWILVDEYQDVSRSTALLLQQLSGPNNPPWVVGDARQAIYRFRGAAPENVSEFRRDFPGARVFALEDNYRSAPEILAIINKLAGLLADSNARSGSPMQWKTASTAEAIGTAPVVLAAANSDLAEREGVVSTVEQWLAAGVQASAIAVLARRNVDVRNIAIALKDRGIRAVTSGLLTPEGAGGDLAAVIASVDLQQALPRVVFALHRRDGSVATLNQATAQLLALDPDQVTETQVSGSAQVAPPLASTWGLFLRLRGHLHSGDGWVVLCEFLFFLSPYLRDLLNRSGEADSSVQLEEVLSTLAVSAQYRFAHPHVPPRRSRLGLGERLRQLVIQGSPGVVPPRADVDGVRVMTCHASKGLEFPCVAVAGQSLADIPPQKQSLPPRLRRDPDEDARQAESLLFVGLSRAQRAATISYAASAGGGPRSRPRRFPSLLTGLRDSGAVPVLKWHRPPSRSEEVKIGRVWGGSEPTEVSTYALSADVCRVRIYLEEQLGTRFRSRVRPLYPDFISRVRRMLRRVADIVVLAARRPSEAEINQIFEEEWPDDHQAEHPHVDLYRPRALRWTQAFAGTLGLEGLRQGTLCDEPFQWPDASGTLRTVKFQLVGHFLDAAGDRLVIALQTGSRGSDGASVNWSEMKDYQRLPFVLLQERHGKVRPLVFLGDVGNVRPFKWKRGRPQDAIAAQSEGARQVFGGVVSGTFDGTIDDWICDRCSCRTVCPWWIGAVD